MLTRIETLQQGWDDFRPSKAQAFWFAAACVAATLIIGFGFAGWVTGGTAKDRVDEAALNARHELAAAVCAEEFMAAKDAPVQLAQLKKATFWDRNQLVANGGWATMPDRKEPNSAVAAMCAERLSQ